MTERETYLGDAVYASFDGWHIWLFAFNTALREQKNARSTAAEENSK